MPIEKNDAPYTDTGTGAYQGPTQPEVFIDDDGTTPTGAYPGPAEPEVYESMEHLDPPTGAAQGPTEPETRYEWPAQAPAAGRVSVATGKASKKAK